MNVFIIPSWYPSADKPLAGIFHQEQAVALANAYPDLQIAISLWGQKTEANLLWLNDHLKNITKLIRFSTDQESYRQVSDNLYEYYSPALTWSRHFLQGNIKNIISANQKNLQIFEARVGKVSLIHAHVAYPAGYIAMRLAHNLQLPYLITEHMSPFPFSNLLKDGKVISQVLEPLKKAKTVIAVSPFAASEIANKTVVQPVVIPNQVDEIIFSPLSTAHIQLPAETFTFFTLGRMVPQKGIPDLLKAISRLKVNNVKFRIGGNGEFLDSYKLLADELGISSCITWLGQLTRAQAAKEFRHCNAFVLPSIHESMGVVFAEAIACGKPIISTRCGGAEFIVNKQNGLLVPVGAVAALAEAMEYMINSYDRYSSQKIREDFMRRFSSAAITSQIYKLYQQTCNQPATN